jgi:hypothetical protein
MAYDLSKFLVSGLDIGMIGGVSVFHFVKATHG